MSGGVGRRVRKVRSDKKKDVKSTIKIELKDAIYRLAYITKKPVKDVCETMINYSVTNSAFIDRMALYFVRDIHIGNRIIRGHTNNSRYSKVEPGNCERISFRLSQTTYDQVSVFAYAMALNPSRISAIILNDCIHDFKFLNTYTSQFLHEQLSYNQMVKLKELLRYITKNVNVEASMASLLSTIVSEVIPHSVNVSDAVDNFIIHNWREKNEGMEN